MSTWIIPIVQFESIWLFCWHPWTPFWSGDSNWGSGEGREGSNVQNLLHSKPIQSTLLCLLSLCLWGAVRCCVDGLRAISPSGKRARTRFTLWCWTSCFHLPMASCSQLLHVFFTRLHQIVMCELRDLDRRTCWRSSRLCGATAKAQLFEVENSLSHSLSDSPGSG